MAKSLTGLGPISREHYKAFGRIVQAFVYIETMYSFIVARLLKIEEDKILLLFSQHSYDGVKNLLKVCIEHASLNATDRKEIEKLISKVHDKSTLRHNVAHNIWKKGRRPKSIKPLVMKTKGRLLILGLDHNEKDWTAKELHEEADEILARGFRVGEFFRLRGVSYDFNKTLDQS